MPYRDDLSAAHVRIAELESELGEIRRQLALRDALARQRWRPAALIALSSVVTLTLVGVGAGQVLFAQGHEEERRANELRRELYEAQADAAEAREDRRVVFEMLAHARDERPTTEPSLGPVETLDKLAGPTDPLASASLFVTSDRAARVAVNGSMLSEWTPALIDLTPGQHAVTVIADDGRVERYTVHSRDGLASRLVVDFDR